MHVIHDNVFVLLRQRWNMLCTSGFENDHDVKFSHKLTLWRSRQSDLLGKSTDLMLPLILKLTH